jgi:hypothetical protein
VVWQLGLVGREGGAVAEALGTVLRSIASLAKNLGSNIGEVSRFQCLLAGGATEAKLVIVLSAGGDFLSEIDSFKAARALARHD